MSRPTGFSLPLTELLGLRQPDVRDQLAAFLTRAATVTVLRYGDTDRLALTRRVTDEVIATERVERADTRLTAASPWPRNRTASRAPSRPTCVRGS